MIENDKNVCMDLADSCKSQLRLLNVLEFIDSDDPIGLF